jgi:PAS domain S-box-containing protein
MLSEHTEQSVDENIRMAALCRAVVERITEGITILNEHAFPVYRSPSMSKITGWSSEERTGRADMELVHPEDRRKVYDALEFVKGAPGEMATVAGRLRHKQGYFVWIEASLYNMLHDPAIGGYLCIFRDITSRKQSELQMEQMHKELVRKHNYLQQYTYIVSHNLKGQVDNIMGLVDIMAQIDVSERDRNEIILGIAYSVKKLDETMKDLSYILNLKNEAERLREPINIPVLLEEVIASVTAQYGKNAFHIYAEINIDTFVSLKGFIYSILHNLISNCIKYRKPDTTANIHIAMKHENGKVVLLVKDDGLGINLQRYGSQVFGLYRRFHQHGEGKGMGLFLVKTQVEALSGTVVIDSAEGEGTEVKIELPLQVTPD